MPWTITELADLAEVSRRTVRHYNAIGLLAPPTRRPNGYKLYDDAHLTRLLQIKRLRGLGFTLARITDLQDGAVEPIEAVRSLDAELAGTVERLRTARAELRAILRDGTSTDLPTGFDPTALGDQLSEADRSFVVVMSRVLGPEPRRAYADLLRNPPNDPASREFEHLRPDAGERTRRDLVDRMVPVVRNIHATFPALREMHAGSPHGAGFAKASIESTKRDLYNAAQCHVMRDIAAALA
jgi:DNA-binding transcriptional MerR regulator